jgi:hypothetical protein
VARRGCWCSLGLVTEGRTRGLRAWVQLGGLLISPKWSPLDTQDPLSLEGTESSKELQRRTWKRGLEPEMPWAAGSCAQGTSQIQCPPCQPPTPNPESGRSTPIFSLIAQGLCALEELSLLPTPAGSYRASSTHPHPPPLQHPRRLFHGAPGHCSLVSLGKRPSLRPPGFLLGMHLLQRGLAHGLASQEGLRLLSTCAGATAL